MRAEGLPAFSLESCVPLAEFDAVGITLPHELAATNVLELLDLAGIPLHAADRTDGDPLVMAGGPCAYNPEPYAPFFDLIIIGEGEEVDVEVLSLHRKMRDEGASARRSCVRWQKSPAVMRRRSIGGFRRKRRRSVAVGSSRSKKGSRPCLKSACSKGSRKPRVGAVRCAVHGSGARQAERGDSSRLHPRVPVLPGRHDVPSGARAQRRQHRGVGFARSAETGYDEVSLTSLSSTDHSQIAEILRRLNEACDGKGIRISIPSQRLDSFGVEMAGLVAGQKKGGLTFAPEAGTQRLRDVINKGVTEEDLFSAIDAAFTAGCVAANSTS